MWVNTNLKLSGLLIGLLKQKSSTTLKACWYKFVTTREYRCFFLFSFATRAGSPLQREPITVGPYYLSHPVNFSCGRKPEYPGKIHDFRLSVDYTLHMRTGFESTILGIELGTLEMKGEWSDHYTTEVPFRLRRMVVDGQKILLSQQILPCVFIIIHTISAAHG